MRTQNYIIFHYTKENKKLLTNIIITTFHLYISNKNDISILISSL